MTRKKNPSKKRREAHPSKPSARRPEAGAAPVKPQRPKGPPWLYGRHAVIAALANPDRYCHRLCLTKEFLENHGQEMDRAIQDGERTRPGAEVVARDELEVFVGPQAIHQGVAAQFDPLAQLSLEDMLADFEEEGSGLIVALDKATDPQNIGAVMRSCAAFGASALLIPQRNAPDLTPALAKTACGALERIPFIQVTNLVRALEQLKEVGFWSVGLDGYADQLLGSVDLKGKTVLVMGSEGSGLRRLTRETCDFLAKIPISQTIESLNLSNATAVALYECARQKEG